MRQVFFDDHDDFSKSLNKKVDDYFSSNDYQRTANSFMLFKLAILLSGVVLFYAAIYFFKDNFVGILLSAFLYGTFTFLIAFNVVHDAGHGALFKSKMLNNLFLHSLDLFGVSSFLWRYKHELHHNSPNVQDADTLIDDFKLGRLHPHGKWTWAFKFQHIYIPILSLFYSASLVLFKDLAIIRSLRSSVSEKNKIPNYEYMIIVLSKMLAFLTTIYLPYTLLDLSVLQVILLFFIIHLGPGLLVGFFVAPAHFNKDVLFPEPDNQGYINYSWAKHQLMTTSDFSTNNGFLNFILGGFNHHVAHHLYPSICHCHYTKITPIIKEVANDFGIPYKSTSFHQIYFSHLKHLKNMAKK